jgi:hypothetical protein
VHEPHLGHQPAVARFQSNRHLLAIDSDGRLHRQVFDASVLIFFLLVTAAVELLLEIALVVKQADCHERHGEAACTFDVITRKHPQAARVDGHGFVEAELGRKICHRHGAEDTSFARTPRRARVGQVFFQPAAGLIDARVEDHLGRPVGQLLGRHFREEHDGIVVYLAPLNRIQIAEQIHDFRVPAPP